MDKTKYTEAIRNRFLQCVDALKQQKRVKSNRDFAISVDYLPQSLSEIQRGKRGIMSELIAKSVEVHGMNPNFIFSGSGPLFIDNIDGVLHTGTSVELRYLQMAMQIQGYAFDYKLLYAFTETYKGLVKMGGEFGLKEAAEIEAEAERLFPTEKETIQDTVNIDGKSEEIVVNIEKSLIEKAEQFAKVAHGKQFYGEYPYGFHLRKTFEVAQRFGLNDNIKIACWLHDTIEDTNVTYDNLELEFGQQIADLVESVTVSGDSRRAKQDQLFEQLLEANHIDCLLLKCCDRIANIEHAQSHNSEKHLKMYRTEHDAFMEFGEKHFELATRLPIWSYLVNIFEK